LSRITTRNTLHHFSGPNQSRLFSQSESYNRRPVTDKFNSLVSLGQQIEGKLEGRSIYIVGMMGVGKTRTSTDLAKYLPSYRKVDTDAVIEKHIQMPISTFFQLKKENEQIFRQIEHNVLANVSLRSHQIIATGGGIILRGDNCEIMKQNGIVVLLHVPIDVIYKNLVNRPSFKLGTRPLLIQKEGEPSPIEKMKSVWAQRKERYFNAADLRIDFDNFTNDRSQIILERINSFLDTNT
jgi:shikimate kinase